MKLKSVLSLFAFLLIGSLAPLCAQVTTATIFGTAIDDKGEPMIGATIVAVHNPSGAQYGTTTRGNGKYTLPNLRIGGPYTVSASFVGFETNSQGDIHLALGQKMAVNFDLSASAQELQEIQVTANINDPINGDRTGAQTTISLQQLQSMPTINRSAADFYRLTPASSGNSFLGRNDQFNNFSLDGSIFNNPFGLDAATPGGQTDAQPIPLEALDQIQVDLSPFDVTQSGFTGASINAVTKSGTNEFHGSVYGYFRNDGLTGNKVSGNEIFVPDLTQLQAGYSIGGPIIKNKLFFFWSFELEQREDLGSSFVASRPGLTASNVSRVAASDLDAVSSALMSRFGYETGPYENFIHNTDNMKSILKLDYHINQNHSLTLKWNWLDASKGKPAHPNAIGRRGPDFTTLQFQNSGYEINNRIYSGILELKSLFGNKAANKLQVGYTVFDDFRNPFSEPFPVISIQEEFQRYIIAGHEPFSIHNRLDQRVLQITDNFSYYAGDHTLTVGFSYEDFDFDNSFNLNTYGGTFGDFSSTQAFLDSLNTGVLDGMVDAARATFENNSEEDWSWARPHLGQFSVYVQDEWQATDNLTLTAGLRMDAPLYFDTEDETQNFIDTYASECCYFPFITYFDEYGQEISFDHTELPEQTPLFSPRFGFNLDIYGDQKSQLRGGAGLFTGRFPFVWIGNHVGNPNFFFYQVTRTDFQFPQVFKGNLGFDNKFKGGWIGSIDLIYSKDINAMMVRNYGLRPPTAKLQGVDNRQIYHPVNDRTEGFANNAYVFTNSDQGYAFNATFKLQRDWGNDFFTSLAYNYGISKDVSSIEAEISGDAYDRNPAFGNVNADVLGHSIYGNRHRIVGNAYKRFSYKEGKMATSLALFFEITEGNRYSYTYSGDINNDGSGLNDLIYIPTDAEINEMTFSGDPIKGTTPAQMAQGLKDYIAQDEYLSERRGDYAEKYGSLAPWFSTIDLRILQDFNFNVGEKTNTVQLSFDILNLGNLISSEWGVRQFPTTTQPIGVFTDGDFNPTYSFDPELTSTFTDDFGLLSRWQLQLGLKYIF